MKKIFGLLLACVMACACFAACGEKPQATYYSASTTVPGGGGVIQLSAISVKEGDTLNVQLKPNASYYATSFTVNGVEQISAVVNNAYVIENVSEDFVFSAKFEMGVAYVSAENAPVIDGEIDDIWDNAVAIYCDENTADVGWVDLDILGYPYVKIMWNETGFYFLGYVYDDVLIYDDVVNFWTNEVYSETTTTYDVVEAYNFCIHYDGTLNPNAFVSLNGGQSGGTLHSEGYIVEGFMPRVGETPLVAGGTMGFAISVDFYDQPYTGTHNRRSIAKWIRKEGADRGLFWIDPSQLIPLKLIAG